MCPGFRWIWTDFLIEKLKKSNKNTGDCLVCPTIDIISTFSVWLARTLYRETVCIYSTIQIISFLLRNKLVLCWQNPYLKEVSAAMENCRLRISFLCSRVRRSSQRDDSTRCADRETVYTPHSTLHIPHSTLHTTTSSSLKQIFLAGHRPVTT